MDQPVESTWHPTTFRSVLIAAITAIVVIALGFAPLNHLWYYVVAGLVATVIIVATGPKLNNISAGSPAVVFLVIPAVLVFAVRNTSLIWFVVPTLAFVMAAAVWVQVQNRYLAQREQAQPQPEVADSSQDDELAPKREEKTATTNDDSSMTAA